MNQSISATSSSSPAGKLKKFYKKKKKKKLHSCKLWCYNEGDADATRSAEGSQSIPWKGTVGDERISWQEQRRHHLEEQRVEPLRMRFRIGIRREEKEDERSRKGKEIRDWDEEGGGGAAAHLLDLVLYLLQPLDGENQLPINVVALLRSLLRHLRSLPLVRRHPTPSASRTG